VRRVVEAVKAREQLIHARLELCNVLHCRVIRLQIAEAAT